MKKCFLYHVIFRFCNSLWLELQLPKKPLPRQKRNFWYSFVIIPWFYVKAIQVDFIIELCSFSLTRNPTTEVIKGSCSAMVKGNYWWQWVLIRELWAFIVETDFAFCILMSWNEPVSRHITSNNKTTMSVAVISFSDLEVASFFYDY